AARGPSRRSAASHWAPTPRAIPGRTSRRASPGWRGTSRSRVPWCSRSSGRGPSTPTGFIARRVVQRVSMLTLYDDVFSPYARKVRIALYEKGVAFERVRALHGDCNRTDFLHVNPRAEVPALVDGDIHLYDSTVICEYL